MFQSKSVYVIPEPSPTMTFFNKQGSSSDSGVSACSSAGPGSNPTSHLNEDPSTERESDEEI
jgi:hypothetical protein